MGRLTVFQLRNGVLRGLWVIIDAKGTYIGSGHETQDEAFSKAESISSIRPGFSR